MDLFHRFNKFKLLNYSTKTNPELIKKLYYDLRNCPEVGGFSLSSGDLISRNKQQNAADAVSKWNPFADVPSFSQVTEDHLFGAEFDKIRQEGEKK